MRHGDFSFAAGRCTLWGVTNSVPGLKSTRTGLLVSACALGALTVVLAPLVDERQITNVALAYLIVTLGASAVWGLRVGMPTAIVADVLVNFFYVPPLHRFTVHQAENIVTLVLFLVVAVAGSVMFELLRRNLKLARQSEAATTALLQASRVLARNESPRVTLDSLCVVIARAAGARGCAILRTSPLEVAGATYDETSGRSPTRDEAAVIVEVMKRGEPAKIRSESGTAIRSMFVPLRGSTPGVLRLAGPMHPSKGIALDAILPGLLDEASVALDRAQLFRQSERASVLERSEEMKSVLLSGVSHDLRSPLTAIKAAVSNLRDPGVSWADEDRDAFLETIESQTDRLTKTVANLLEMSRLEAGVTAHLEPIELAPLADELVLAHAVAVRHPLNVSIPHSTWVRGDYGLLFQALSNLLENAGKYSPAGTPIELSAESRPGRVFIRVTDHGPGIPEADLPHVFEKFYRGAATSAIKGSGLGLALAKAMVEACRGTIRVDSSPAGTTFEISVPAAAEPSR